MAATSSPVSRISAAPAFSWIRSAFREPGNGHDVRLFAEHPGKGDLGGRGLFLPGQLVQNLKQLSVGFKRFRGILRHAAAVIVRRIRLSGPVSAGQIPFARGLNAT